MARMILHGVLALAIAAACGADGGGNAGVESAAELPPVYAGPPLHAQADTGPAGPAAAPLPETRTADSTSPTRRQTPPDTELAAGAAQQDPRQMLRRTAGLYAAMRAMQADFTMVTRNPLIGSTATSRGTLFQRRPDRILLRFEQPRGDMILGDGRYFWIYYPSVDPGQVTRTSAAGQTGVVDLQAQFVGDPLARYDHTIQGRETVGGRETVAILLVPHEDPGYRSLEIWIDVEDSLVRRFEVTDNNGIVRRLDLSNLETNPTLPDELFRFTPPEGVRVVER